MWTDGATRVLLAGAPGAGKSRLLDAIAGGARVPIQQAGTGARWIETVTARRRYQMVDVPADDVDALIADVHLVVIVVAATDGPMPATKRHLEAVQRTGRACVVYVDDAAIAASDVEIVELVEMEMREMTQRLHLHVSVLRGRGDPKSHVMGGVGAIASALDAT